MEDCCNAAVDEVGRRLEDMWHAHDEKQREKITELEATKNGAYKERDMLLSLLTKVMPNDSWLERHPDSDTAWENDWRWIVFIDLPTGQASWHIHDSELPWFDHLGRRAWQAIGKNPSWDGHTTEEKYQRVLAVSPTYLAD